ELWLVDDGERAGGFLVMDGEMIDALFVDPAVHGRGYGTALLDHALKLSPHATVDASEQASNALAFYEARGFIRTGRSETDPQGRPYPLIHLKYPGTGSPIYRLTFRTSLVRCGRVSSKLAQRRVQGRLSASLPHPCIIRPARLGHSA